MDPFSLPPLAAVLDAAHGALLGLAALLQPLAGASATAAAIVLVTLAVRAVLVPVGVAQARAEQTRARLAPRLRALRERHARDPERLQRETMRLYAEEKASPFAGCLPVLLQAPVVALVYALFLHPAIAGHANALLGATLFGVPLGRSLAGALGTAALDPVSLAVLGGLVVLVAAVGELTRRAFPARTPDAPPLVGRLLEALPFATAVVAVFVPLAAGLYLLVTSAWTLVQRIVLRRRFPLPAPPARPR
jgi:YidC/Oxa1 family membrane protein insertase